MPFLKGHSGKGGGGPVQDAAERNACSLCGGGVSDEDARGYINGTCSKCGPFPFHFDCVSEYLEKNTRVMNSNSKAMEKGRIIARNRPQDLFAQNRTVQRKPQKCPDSSCSGLMVAAELVKPAKAQPAELPPPAAPAARAKKAPPAPASAKQAPKQQRQQPAAELGTRQVAEAAKPVAPAQISSTNSHSSAIKAGSTAFSQDAGATQAATAALDAKQQLQRLRASAAAARASLGIAVQGPSGAAGKSSAGLLNRVGTGSVAGTRGSGSSRAGASLARHGSSGSGLGGLAEVPREVPGWHDDVDLQAVGGLAADAAVVEPAPEPEARPAGKGREAEADEDVELKMAIAASLAEAQHGAGLSVPMGASATPEMGSSTGSLVQVYETPRDDWAASWPAPALADTSAAGWLSKAAHGDASDAFNGVLPTLSPTVSGLDKPAACGEDSEEDLDSASLAAALRQQQQVLQQQWRQRGTQHRWAAPAAAQPPLQPAPPALSPPPLQHGIAPEPQLPWKAHDATQTLLPDHDQHMTWQPTSGPALPPGGHMPSGDARAAWEPVQQSVGDETEVDELLGLLGITA